MLASTTVPEKLVRTDPLTAELYDENQVFNLVLRLNKNKADLTFCLAFMSLARSHCWLVWIWARRPWLAMCKCFYLSE